MDVLGDRLDKAAKERGCSWSALAHACNVSPGAITQWRKGQTKMSAAAAYRAAAYLGVNFLWLTEGRGPMRGEGVVALPPAEPLDSDEIALLAAYRRLDPRAQAKILLDVRYQADLAELAAGPPDGIERRRKKIRLSI
jgi:transcriptional regulator with XRE-family HTH domain